MRRVGALLALLTLRATTAMASPDSLATLRWRNPEVALGRPGPRVRAALDVHLNPVVRGVARYRRPDAAPLGLRTTLVSEARIRPASGLELTWLMPYALQDREGIRAEIPHSESSHEVRIRRHLALAPELTVVPAAAALVSIQDTGSVRYELSGTVAWDPGLVTLEAQLLHHQAALVEDPAAVAFLYGHVQLHEPFHPGRWLLLPLLRASVEARERDPAEGPAWTLQAGLLTAWSPRTLPVRVFIAGHAWYRADLEQRFYDVSVGLQGVFAGSRE